MVKEVSKNSQVIKSSQNLKRNLVRAYRLANLSSQGVGRSNNNRLGAVVFKGKDFTGGWNSYKTHPKLKMYHYPVLHAEAHAMINHGLYNCDGWSLVVTRVLRNGEMTMAKPCECCVGFMKEYGIKNIYYTNWNGDLEQLDT